jgi:hypothetical protein
MSQYKNESLSASMVDVNVDVDACQLTGYTIYNPNSTDVWIHFHDSHDVSSAATGSTSAYKVLCPANSQVVENCETGTSDPDGFWAFQTGMTIKAVTGFADTNNTPPSSAVSVWLQIKP